MINAALPLSLFEEPPAVGDVVVRPIEYQLAAQTVLRYHYSHRMPQGNLRCYGAWEGDAQYVGTVIFGDGASQQIGEPYGLDQSETVELVRVAFTMHDVAVTRVIAETIRDLHSVERKLRLIVSFADEKQGHLGKIYQAGNWIYTGLSLKTKYLVINGEEMHDRAVTHKYGTQSVPWLRANVDPNAERVTIPPKHRYLYPLDRAMRRRVLKLAKPYPRGLSVVGDTAPFQGDEASSTLADRSMKVQAS